MFRQLSIRGFNYLRRSVVKPIALEQKLLLYQGLVIKELARMNIQDDFYPVGTAADYGLFCFLIRLFQENAVDSIVELGSGETTRLIDRLKAPGAAHVCYEDNPQFYRLTEPKLASCDYRLRDLVDDSSFGIDHRWYRDVELTPFDVILVDGPVGGSTSFSRVGCWNLISVSASDGFVAIIDDCRRRGERQTLEFVVAELRKRGRDVYVKEIPTPKGPTVICSGKYAHTRFYI